MILTHFLCGDRYSQKDINLSCIVSGLDTSEIKASSYVLVMCDMTHIFIYIVISSIRILLSSPTTKHFTHNIINFIIHNNRSVLYLEYLYKGSKKSIRESTYFILDDEDQTVLWEII